MDEVFRALADPSRRRLLDSLNLRDGQTLRELCAELSMTRQSVSKHLAVLEAAGLVTSFRRGREKLHHLDTEPINALADRWITQYDRTRAPAPAAPGTAPPPASAAGDDAFVYPLYLATTPERLWQAITDPVISQRHLGHAMVSRWEKGATYTWLEDGQEFAHPDQVVLDADPYRRISFSFHTVAPGERRSQVRLEIEPVDGQVRLTLVHDGFAPGSVVLQRVRQRWPYALSALKTGLERVPS